jgi:DNA-binding MarR family transcriptional regulator
MEARSRNTMTKEPKPIWIAWQGFLRAYKVVRDRLDTALRKAVPLSFTEYDVLYCVSDAGGRLRYIELSKRVYLSQSRVSRQIVSLEEKGYLTREATDTDRRATFAVMTDAGRRVLRDAEEPLRRAWHEHFLHHIPPADLKTFTRIMLSLVAEKGQWAYDLEGNPIEPVEG